jgi:hypothetical protein
MPTGIYNHKAHTKKAKVKIGLSLKGVPKTKDHSKKIGEANKGKNNWTKGSNWRLSGEKLKRRIIINGTGKNSPAYKNGKWCNGSEDKEYISWEKNRRNRIKSILNNQGLGHSYGEWDILKKQYGNTCPCCKKSEPEIKLTEDHIIPLSKGGGDLIENIQPLCIKCNIKKNVKTIKYGL